MSLPNWDMIQNLKELNDKGEFPKLLSFFFFFPPPDLELQSFQSGCRTMCEVFLREGDEEEQGVDFMTKTSPRASPDASSE